MATKEHHSKKAIQSFSSSRSFIFLICLASLLLASSLFKSSLRESRKLPEQNTKTATGDTARATSSSSCDYSDGQWIPNLTADKPLRYDQTCKEIFKGWNCIVSNKFNGIDLIKWRWKPYQCELPQFDPLLFLQHFRNTNIGTFSSFSLGFIICRMLDAKEKYFFALMVQ